MRGYMKSSEAAALIGITRATLSHYEKLGLIVPDRVLPSKHRLYSMETVDLFIRKYCGDSDGVRGSCNAFMTSGEVCMKLGVGKRELEQLEQSGILYPRRKLPVNNTRLYALDDIDAYRSIRSNIVCV